MYDIYTVQLQLHVCFNWLLLRLVDVLGHVEWKIMGFLNDLALSLTKDSLLTNNVNDKVSKIMIL